MSEEGVWIEDIDFEIVEKDLSHADAVPILIVKMKAHGEWVSLNMKKEQLIRLRIAIDDHFEKQRQQQLLNKIDSMIEDFRKEDKD